MPQVLTGLLKLRPTSSPLNQTVPSLMFNAIFRVDAQHFFFKKKIYRLSPFPRQWPFIKINEIRLLFCLLGIHHLLWEGVKWLFLV